MLCKAERNTRTPGESGEKLERKIDAMPSKYRELADKEFNARRNLNVVKSVEIAVKNVRRVWKLGSKRFGPSNDKSSGKITVKNILRAGQLLGKKIRQPAGDSVARFLARTRKEANYGHYPPVLSNLCIWEKAVAACIRIFQFASLNRIHGCCLASGGEFDEGEKRQPVTVFPFFHTYPALCIRFPSGS